LKPPATGRRPGYRRAPCGLGATASCPSARRRWVWWRATKAPERSCKSSRPVS